MTELAPIPIILGAIFWRLRGTAFGWQMAACFAIIVAGVLISHGTDTKWAVAYAIWVWLGERPGWGVPLGQALGYANPQNKSEWYQRIWSGYLFRHPWLALVFRGAMIGGIGAIIFPLGAWMAKKLEHRLPDWPLLSGKWEWQEFFFGGLFILALQGLVYVY